MAYKTPLYPEIEPCQHFFLQTGSAHSIYVEVSGNPDGLPVVFLHGGPCSGTRPIQRRFFDPHKYRIILFDQRACGRSLPFGDLQNNTTQDLIADMERIRQHLGISKWLLFGGSWGAALALLYAQQHSQRVAGMILRGVFLARQKDLDWFIREGAGRIYPEQWQCLQACIPAANSSQDLIAGLNKTLWDENASVCIRAAQAWSDWGSQVAVGADFNAQPVAEADRQKLLQQTRMELHYAAQRYFIAENQILAHCGALQAVPAIIIHGRYDLVCPLESGHSLHQALPDAEFQVLPHAGHIAEGKEMLAALLAASDKMAKQLLD